MEVGQDQPREQAGVTGCSPGTSASSTRPGKTGGCSATAPAAPTSTASPGPTSSDTRSSSTRASPDDPELADYWALATTQSVPADQPHRLSAPPRPRTDAARSARPRSSPPQTAHKPHANGSTWLATTRKTIDRRLGHSHIGRRWTTVSSTSTATPRHSHQGLLEPDAGKLARPVLKGARRRKAPGLPDERARPARPALTSLSPNIERRRPPLTRWTRNGDVSPCSTGRTPRPQPPYAVWRN